MFGSMQFGSVQFGSIIGQLAAGYLTTVFEGFSVSDDALIDGTFVQDETIIIQDTLTIIGVGMLVLLQTHVCDVALLIDPTEGTQVGLWRRTPKNDTIWRRIC